MCLCECIIVVVEFFERLFCFFFDELVDNVFASVLMVLSNYQGLLRSGKSVACFGVVLIG